MSINKNELIKLVSQFDESGTAFKTIYKDNHGNFYVEDRDGNISTFIENPSPSRIELGQDEIRELQNLYISEMVSPEIENENPDKELSNQVIHKLS